jgi:toxin secretion/phage lysis holin
MRSLRVLFTLLGGFLGFMLGGVDAFLYTLIAFVAIDYISGVLVAICEKKVSSKIGARGISKKIMLFALIAVANLIDCNLTNTSVLRTATIFFYMSNELISILENADKLGLPVPEKLRNILEQFKNK